MLREAGARLPTKVGQTIGIVGGIVIGQASVEAALTSTILLIAVALSALASFTTPTVKMSSTIRLLRFPLILLAGAFGGLGLIVGFVFILAHLIKLKSLGSPYLLPLYPFRGLGTAEGFLRLPFSQTAQRPSFLRPKSKWRYNPNKVKQNVMVIMNEKLLLYIIIIFFILQTGCTQTYIVDTQRIIHIVGFDITKTNNSKELSYSQNTHGVKSKPETQSTSARSLETIASRLNAKSPHNVVVGQMRVVLFGKALGERGMGEIITNLQRDPNIGRDVQLAIVDGTAEELLNYGKNGSLYIADLLEQNIRNENIPQTELNIFYIIITLLYVMPMFLILKWTIIILSLSKDLPFERR